jgi:hypothetical protein
MKKTRTALFWVIRQQVVVISYRHFGTTFWSHVQNSRFLAPKYPEERSSQNRRWFQVIKAVILFAVIGLFFYLMMFPKF